MDGTSLPFAVSHLLRMALLVRPRTPWLVLTPDNKAVAPPAESDVN